MIQMPCQVYLFQTDFLTKYLCTINDMWGYSSLALFGRKIIGALCLCIDQAMYIAFRGG